MKDQAASHERELVMNIADSAILEMKRADGWWTSESATALRRRMLPPYSELRKTLPEAEAVPSYISEEDRAAYLEKNRELQRYMEGFK
jgi:hypothetical protein